MHVLCSCSVELVAGRHIRTLTVQFHSQHSNMRRDVARSLARFHPEEGGSVMPGNIRTLRFVTHFNTTISGLLAYSVRIYITGLEGV